jgi:hypothetical protein
MQDDDWVTGMNAFTACDEREVAKVVDLLGTEGWADYVAGHSDLLLAATDPGGTGVPGRPIWPDYYTYLSIGPDIPHSLILKRVDQIGHGATGTFLEHVGAVYEMGKKEPAFLEHFQEASAVNRFLCEKASLLVGSTAQVDVALVTPTDTLKYGRDKDTVRDADNTNAGIAHALTRLHRSKRWLYQDAFTAQSALRYPAVLATLGGLASDQFLEEARKYVEAGGKLYLEGLPEKDIYNQPRPHRLDELIGARITPLAAQTTELFLPGPGEAARLKVRRLAKIEAIRPGVEVLAGFTDGSPAVLSRRIGRGRLIWAPHQVVRDASFAYIQAVTRNREKPFPFWAGFDVRYCRFYGEILSRLGVGGMTVTGTDNDAARVAVLQTAEGTKLLSLVNYGDEKTLSIGVPGEGTYLADLRTGRQIAFTRSGQRVVFAHRASANSWTFFALAKDRAALEREMTKPLYRLRLVQGDR